MSLPTSQDIVMSLAGHDEGAFYMVLGQEGGKLLLSNGRNRKMENPKRKSPKHVRTVSRAAQAPETDKALRKTLALATGVAAKEDTHLG
jgi:hypothetical protein